MVGFLISVNWSCASDTYQMSNWKVLRNQTHYNSKSTNWEVDREGIGTIHSEIEHDYSHVKLLGWWGVKTKLEIITNS